MTLRVLHIGWGFTPLRSGGLISYAEDLMRLQRGRGIEVGYFCAGRIHWPKRAARLSEWQRHGVSFFEIEDPPLLHAGDEGNFPAEYELQEPESERFFEETLRRFRPDLIHIHELAGLPFSLLRLARETHHLPVVMTLHNYFMLCPTLNLYRPDGTFCVDDDPTRHCAKCHGDGWEFRAHLIRNTLALEKSSLRRFFFSRSHTLHRRLHLRPPSVAIGQQFFFERLKRNLEHLRSIDLLVSQSTRTAEIYRCRIGRDDIKVLHSAPAGIESLQAKVISGEPRRIRFATLNGCLAPYKGAVLIADAVEMLKARGLEGSYVLELWGDVHQSVRSRLLNSAAVRFRGRYRQSELNEILEPVDVGIIPSLCEEVYGFTGIEFLAKGIPLIGNPRGGITDYLIEGSTGWLNQNCSAEGLADLMEGVMKEPAALVTMNRWIRAHGHTVIASRQAHVDALLSWYAEALKKKGSFL